MIYLEVAVWLLISFTMCQPQSSKEKISPNETIQYIQRLQESVSKLQLIDIKMQEDDINKWVQFMLVKQPDKIREKAPQRIEFSLIANTILLRPFQLTEATIKIFRYIFLRVQRIIFKLNKVIRHFVKRDRIQKYLFPKVQTKFAKFVFIISRDFYLCLRYFKAQSILLKIHQRMIQKMQQTIVLLLDLEGKLALFRQLYTRMFPLRDYLKEDTRTWDICRIQNYSQVEEYIQKMKRYNAYYTPSKQSVYSQVKHQSLQQYKQRKNDQRIQRFRTSQSQFRNESDDSQNDQSGDQTERTQNPMTGLFYYSSSSLKYFQIKIGWCTLIKSKLQQIIRNILNQNKTIQQKLLEINKLSAIPQQKITQLNEQLNYQQSSNKCQFQAQSSIRQFFLQLLQCVRKAKEYMGQIKKKKQGLKKQQKMIVLRRQQEKQRQENQRQQSLKNQQIRLIENKNEAKIKKLSQFYLKFTFLNQGKNPRFILMSLKQQCQNQIKQLLANTQVVLTRKQRVFDQSRVKYKESAQSFIRMFKADYHTWKKSQEKDQYQHKQIVQNGLQEIQNCVKKLFKKKKKCQRKVKDLFDLLLQQKKERKQKHQRPRPQTYVSFAKKRKMLGQTSQQQTLSKSPRIVLPQKKTQDANTQIQKTGLKQSQFISPNQTQVLQQQRYDYQRKKNRLFQQANEQQISEGVLKKQRIMPNPMNYPKDVGKFQCIARMLENPYEQSYMQSVIRNLESQLMRLTNEVQSKLKRAQNKQKQVQALQQLRQFNIQLITDAKVESQRLTDQKIVCYVQLNIPMKTLINTFYKIANRLYNLFMSLKKYQKQLLNYLSNKRI